MPLVINRIEEHYDYATKNIEKDNVIGIFLTGSQNYGTDMPFSDVDTKLLITPSLKDIYRDKKAESSTLHMPDSNEQISVKDIRHAFLEIKKQNINILEILFTDYCILNTPYKDLWNQLISKREEIVRYNPLLAVKTIKGMTLNAYDRLYKDDNTINQKQVANFVRFDYYLDKYIDGAPYFECIRPDELTLKYITQIRMGEIGPSSLVAIADNTVKEIQTKIDNYCMRKEDIPFTNPDIEDFLDEICKEFIDTSFFIEYAKRGDL